LEAVAALQHHTSELQGFVLWYEDYHRGRVTKTCRLWGAIAENVEEYRLLVEHDIPVWMRLDLSRFLRPRSVCHIQLTPLSKVCDMRCWHQLPHAERTQINIDDHGWLVHGKDILFYPPHVNDPHMFERAAHGYAPRLDKFNPDKRVTRELARLSRVPCMFVCFVAYFSVKCIFIVDKHESSGTDNRAPKKIKKSSGMFVLILPPGYCLSFIFRPRRHACEKMSTSLGRGCQVGRLGPTSYQDLGSHGNT
jgi:hypothetical protein